MQPFNLNRYFFIPLGDHCAPALLLNELGLRKKSYPFDWIAHIDEYSGSCMPIILSLCSLVSETGNITDALEHFLPQKNISNPTFTCDSPLRNWIRFPHDQFLVSDTLWQNEYHKYERRFIRFYKALISRKPIIFLCICRSYLLSPRDFSIIEKCLLAYNKLSKFIFISGQSIPHSCLSESRILQVTVQYRNSLPSYVEYSDMLYYNHDLGYWRRNVNVELLRILATIPDF